MIALHAGRLTLELRPDIGGSMTEFRLDEKPLMRPTSADAIASLGARGCASYPLVPYSNRLRDNRFTFAGRTYALPATLNGQAIHGVGWRRPWQVAAATTGHATLAYEHTPDADWPFAFRAEQHFALAPDGLSCRFVARNLAPHEAPMGFGPHPFFARPPGTSLRFSARLVWQHDEKKIPTHATNVPPAWDFSAGRDLDSFALDHCFSDWGGNAEILLPYARIAMTADPSFRHLIVFIPEGRDFFAVEPVTNLTDGLNRMHNEAQDGKSMSNIFLLAPGEQREASFRLAVTPA
jgi:aldose 1-epimerase